jgi:hypothetical protein
MKSGQGLAVGSLLRRQDFHGDGAAQPDVLSPVNNTHPTFAQLLHNPIVGQDGADHAGNAVSRRRSAAEYSSLRDQG